MGRDIIIHYDETEGKIVCSTVEHGLVASLLKKALPMEVPVLAFQRKTPDEAERSLGAGVFALLDLSATEKIGIREYRSLAAHWEVENTSRVDDDATTAGADAQYERAMALVTDGMRTKSKEKMDAADTLLILAARAGNAEAREYLEDLWPALKARAQSYT